MFRLTVGRRLALLVAVTMAALLAVVFVLLQQLSAAAVDRSTNDLESVARPLAAAVDQQLDAASRILESEASSFDPEEEVLTMQHIRANGFAAVDIGDSSTGDSRIDVSSNFLQRASGEASVGATQIFDGRVGVVMGAPLVGGGGDGDVLVGVFDASGLLQLAETTRSGTSTEALFAARNTDGDLVIFSPSRHNDEQPIGMLDEATAELVDQVFTTGEAQRFDNAMINGRQSVSVMAPVDSSKWVVVASMDRADAGTQTIPWWLLPALAMIGLLSIWPIALLRNRLKAVVIAAQQLSRGRLTHELTDETDDEIGLLAQTLQTLDARLQSDTEARGRSAAMLQHRATHDPLTGLANRARLMEELTIALNNREDTSVIFCDIDGFKGINDSQGHEGGDLVLKFVANQLGSVAGGSELIARFGGDEFCVLSRSDGQSARALATKVERALDTTCVVNGTQLRVGGSVGLAVAKVTDTPDSLLKSADLAMYREKERRRGLRRAARVDDDIEISLEQIRLVFQPVVKLSNAEIIGVEVLARYMHPEMGMLDPSSFLPPGTEQGMFNRFDLEILTRSMAQLSEWLSEGAIDERFTMSVNLAPDHVSDSDSTRQIFDIIRQHRIPPAMIQIEVTEQKLFAHEDDLINSLNLLREAGMKIAIDDFGIEGSNVDRLLQIPSDVVKIDRSFVSDIDIDERAENRLRAMLELVATEGHVAIAEGVERAGQARMLRAMNVPLGQGYLWHAPISALALAPLLGRASRWNRKKPEPRVG